MKMVTQDIQLLKNFTAVLMCPVAELNFSNGSIHS